MLQIAWKSAGKAKQVITAYVFYCEATHENKV